MTPRSAGCCPIPTSSGLFDDITVPHWADISSAQAFCSVTAGRDTHSCCSAALLRTSDPALRLREGPGPGLAPGDHESYFWPQTALICRSASWRCNIHGLFGLVGLWRLSHSSTRVGLPLSCPSIDISACVRSACSLLRWLPGCTVTDLFTDRSHCDWMKDRSVALSTARQGP